MASISWTKTSNGDATPIAIFRSSSGSVKTIYLNVLRDPNGKPLPAHVQYGTASGDSVVQSPGGGGFEVIPTTQEEKRDVVLVMGQSGVGKSYFLRAFANNYMRMHARRKVFLLSGLDEDKTLDALRGVDRIDRTKLAADRPDKISAWKDALVMIDDIENLPKDEGEAAGVLQATVLTQGRHECVTLLRAMHPSSGKWAKSDTLLLAEATGVVVYPGTDDRTNELLLGRLGISEARVRRILSSKTRWVFVSRGNPGYTVSEFECRLL